MTRVHWPNIRSRRKLTLNLLFCLCLFPFLSFPFLSFPFLFSPFLSSSFLSSSLLSFPLLSSSFLSFPPLSSPPLPFPFLSFPLRCSRTHRRGRPCGYTSKPTGEEGSPICQHISATTETKYCGAARCGTSVVGPSPCTASIASRTRQQPRQHSSTPTGWRLS